MCKKKILTKVISALLCGCMLMLPLSAAAQENNPAENPLTETTKISTSTEGTETPAPSVEDKAPVVEKTDVTMKPEGTLIPITPGTGKYEATKIVCAMEQPYPGIEPTMVGEISMEYVTEYGGIIGSLMFDRNIDSGQAGYYPITLQFINEAGEVVYEDKDSVRIFMAEDWSHPKQEDVIYQWDGSSDLVFPFDPGSGLGKIKRLFMNGGVENPDAGVGIHDESLINPDADPDLYTMHAGEDYVFDPNGTMTIKSSYLKKLASEDETFGDAEFYYVDLFYQPMGAMDLSMFYFQFTYDKNASNPSTPVKEVTLTKDNTSVSSNDMATLVEENKTSDVVIHNPNGIDFTFAKGTMKLIDGKNSYDFGATLITDVKDSEVSGVSEDEFAFRVNFNYSGNLPGKAKISFSLGKDSKWIGQTLYYSQVESGKVTEQIYKNTVDQNGVYTVEQTHCSDYIATTKAMNQGSDSPQTGNNNNMMLWVALLFVSGTGLLGATTYNRKKKYSK